MNSPDPRLNAFRPELADLSLEGKVRAARFVAGQALRVTAPQAAVRKTPSASAQLETEALHGERVKVFEATSDGWVWAQLADDRYVGWMRRADLSEGGLDPTHLVSVPRTLVFTEPDIKSPLLGALPFGARVAATRTAEDRNARYALIEQGGAVVMQHLASLDALEADPVSIAERFLGAPYLWGGKTSLGLDCSALVQVALGACGIAVPRDTDMQEGSVGAAVPLGPGLPAFRRGDLVFWKGHVAMLRDGETLIHANAYHMAVAIEPLAVAQERYSRHGLAPTAVRRPQLQ